MKEVSSVMNQKYWGTEPVVFSTRGRVRSAAAFGFGCPRPCAGDLGTGVKSTAHLPSDS